MTDPWPHSPTPQEGFNPAAPNRRRLGPRLVLIGALVLALSAGGFFVLTRPRGPDVALALGFQEGGVHRYRTTSSMDLRMAVASLELPVRGELSNTTTYRVVEVEPDGTATIDVDIEDVEATLVGMPIPEDALELDTRLVVAPDGRILEMNGQLVPDELQQLTQDPAGMGTFPGQQQQFPLLPDGAVGPGDEWVKDFDQPLPFGMGAMRIHTENEFVRYEDLGGTRVAVIESVISAPFDWTIELADVVAATATVEGQRINRRDLEGMPSRVIYEGTGHEERTTWFDPRLGEILRIESAGEFDVTARAEGGDGLGSLMGAFTLSFGGAVELTMEQLTP